MNPFQLSHNLVRKRVNGHEILFTRKYISTEIERNVYLNKRKPTPAFTLMNNF